MIIVNTSFCDCLKYRT